MFNVYVIHFRLELQIVFTPSLASIQLSVKLGSPVGHINYVVIFLRQGFVGLPSRLCFNMHPSQINEKPQHQR